jgi:hypothetical protein
VLVTLLTVVASAQPGGGSWSGYQRKGMYAGQGNGPWTNDWRHRPMPQHSSQVSAGSFQRPYPYHLDYYRMKYGGSYAPYFGNLYGPPNFFVGSPFFGGFSPYLGGTGFWPSQFGGGFGDVYGTQGYGWPNNGWQGGGWQGGGRPPCSGPDCQHGPWQNGYGMPMPPFVENNAAAAEAQSAE